MPSMSQAGSYFGTLAYLAAVARTGRAGDGAAVVSAMRAAGVFDHPLFGKTSVRADGRVIQHVSRRSQETLEMDEALRLLQNRFGYPGRQGVPSAQRRRMPACEVSKARKEP